MPLHRILILEDNVDHLELLTALLETHFSPVDIHTVETLEDCLDFLEQMNYDMVMADCFIAGKMITDRLRHIVELAQGAPTIVITGSGDEKLAAEVIKQGVSEYVVKTRKSLEELPSIVERHLKHRPRRKKTTRPAPDQAIRFIREIDKLTQKARGLTATIAASSLPKDISELDALLDHIRRLRDTATKMMGK